MTQKIGILHSLTGTMALSERPLVDAALMAIDEINLSGGISGTKIEPVVRDGASDPDQFAKQARQLIEIDGVMTIFGCWTSASRKSVMEIVERLGAQLWYPVQYEGLESSRNIFYTGSTLNQQISPALAWCIKNLGHRIFLVGSDYVFPRTSNRLIRAEINDSEAIVVGEAYRPLGDRDFSDVIRHIEETRPDFVFNTINGDSNIAFFQHLNAQLSDDMPAVMSVSMAEPELQAIGEAAKGHFLCWGYYQSLDNVENKVFVEGYQSRYGRERTTSDTIATAYSQVHLWKNIVNALGTFDITKIREAAPGQSFLGPTGRLEITANNHVAKNAIVGKVGYKGQVDMVEKVADMIAPLPWLGVENMKLPSIELVKEALGTLPEAIDQKAKAEQQSRLLTEARNKLQRYVDLVDKFIITTSTDTQGNITKVSEAFARVSKFTKKELLGRSHNIVRHPDIPADLYKRVWETIQNGNNWHGEIQNRAKDGHSYWVEIDIAPDYGPDGVIDGYTAIQKDITDKKRVEKLSVTDSLTGLFNRFKIDETIANELSRSQRHGHPLSIVLFDIDHFKDVNDTYGHQVGDGVLIQIARLTQGILRANDTAGRWGGEEFVIICPDTDAAGATAVAEKLRIALGNHSFPTVGNKTASFGVAGAISNEAANDVILRADEALYRAKNNGRNRVEVAN